VLLTVVYVRLVTTGPVSPLQLTSSEPVPEVRSNDERISASTSVSWPSRTSVRVALPYCSVRFKSSSLGLNSVTSLRQNVWFAPGARPTTGIVSESPAGAAEAWM
jgi:hypothetical protein